MKLRPPRNPHTLFNTHFDRATKTMVVDGFALMQNGKYVPAYEGYLKNTLLDIRAIYQRLQEDGERINELRNDPDSSEKVAKAAQLRFEIGDILYQAEQIIWQRLSLMGLKKA